MEKLLYIETFGCQMNERDSEIMGSLLEQSHYTQTKDIDRADLILVNTCSIRAKAEQKVYSLLGRLKTHKTKRPSLIIAVAGCVAQQEREKIHSRMPHVDIVLGTQHIYQLPQLVSRIVEDRRQLLAVGLSAKFTIPPFTPARRDSTCKQVTPVEIKKFVTIMQGCNNFCTYCVVPFTRGREVSRPAADIIAEISRLAEIGVREVTLLGQNVNSYGKNSAKTSEKTDFPTLLEKVAAIQGIRRIRFTTSNPSDLSEELMQAFSRIDKLCPHFHLPVQSGSNKILKRMNRRYTVEAYEGKVEALRHCWPDIALSTDIIVGFPGETEDEFDETMQLLERVRFHSAFTFKYSDRPNTKSASFEDKVPESEKKNRLATLQKKQNQITLERNREYIGKKIPVMVEGESKTARGQISGRSTTNQIVNFAGSNPQPGEIITVHITEGLLHSLRGIICSES
jgi:tRNA-2-methylthio-N6-dimethylallyladenosine synthase